MRPSDVPFEHPAPISFGGDGTCVHDDGNVVTSYLD
jgi:hypothetical protein